MKNIVDFMKRPFVRSVLSILFGLALGVGGFFLAARSFKATPQIVEIWPIAVAIGVTILVWFIQGAIIALLGWPELGSIKVLSMTRLYLASQAAAAITPFMGGEIVYQVAEFKRLGLQGDGAGAVITIRSVMNGAVLMVGVLVGLIFVPYVPFVRSIFGLGDLGSKILLASIVILIVVGGAAAFLVVMRKRGSQPGSEEEGSRKKEERGRLARLFSKIAAKIFEYVSHVLDCLEWIWRQEPRVVIGCVGLMIVYWALYSLLGTMALRAAGWTGSGWLTVYFAQFVLFIVLPLSPTPGGSGGAEVAFAALMSGYVPSEALLGGLIIWRILNHYSELVVGAFLAGPRLPEDIEIAKQEIDEAKQEFGSESS